MTQVIGQFDVSLSTAVDVDPDFEGQTLAPCSCQIGKDNVTISPLSYTPMKSWPEGDYDSPQLVEIRVCISKEVDLNRDPKGGSVLSRDSESMFEKIIIEAVRRFLTIVKLKTNQWDLDTRYPIHAYSYQYSSRGKPLRTAWPLTLGSKRMPEYTEGTIVMSSKDFHEELTSDIWKEVAAEVLHPAAVPLHDELLNDAKTFRSQMRYDASALYAAISSELMLEKACVRLLQTRSSLSVKQCEALTSKLRMPQILDLIRELDPTLPLKYEDINKLFQLRNKIAHGETRTSTWREEVKALGITEMLKNDLEHILSHAAP